MRLWCLWCLCVAHAARCSVLFADVETLNRLIRSVSARDREWHGVLALDVRVNGGGGGVDERVAGMPDDGPPASGGGRTVRAQRVVSYLAAHADSTTGRQIRFGVDVLGKAVSCQFTYTLAVHAFIAHRHAVNRPRFAAADLRAHLVNVRAALVGYVDRLTFLGQDAGGHVLAGRMIGDVLSATRGQPPDAQRDRMVRCLGRLAQMTKEWAAAGCGLTDRRDMVKLVRLKDYDRRIHTRAWTDVDDNCVVAMINDFDRYEFVTFPGSGPELWTRLLDVHEPDDVEDSSDPAAPVS